MLLALEGYEVDIADDSWLNRKYTNVAGDWDDNGVNGRRHGTAQTGKTSSVTYDLPTLAVVRPRVITGFGLRCLSGSPGGTSQIIIRKASTEQLRLETFAINNSFDRGLRIVTGAGTLTIPRGLVSGRWYYIEMDATIHTSTGSVQVWIDNTSVFSQSGINTAAAGSNDWDVFRVVLGAGEFFDDHYVLDDQAGLNTRLGPVVIEGLLPNGDTGFQDWTPSTGTQHFSLVDDLASNIAVGTDRVLEDQITQNELFDFPSIVTMPNASQLDGVQVGIIVGMDSSGSRNLVIRFRDTGGGTSDGSTIAVSGTPTVYNRRVLEQNPVTVVPFSVASFNAGMFGVRTVA